MDSKFDKEAANIDRAIMEKQGVSIDEYIKVRRDFHKHAEIGFQEFRTQ
jgi:metal-dependent amidase/aminoacylase/carboxypeptidase family protein